MGLMLWNEPHPIGYGAEKYPGASEDAPGLLCYTVPNKD